MLDVISKHGNEELALVYVAKTKSGKYLEFVESIQPPLLRKEKWVLIVSTLFGCPVRCLMCDAGGNYCGKVSKEEIFAQIDYLIASRFPNHTPHCQKLKIQFARMGEPAFNPEVLKVLEELPNRYQNSCLIPCISTVAPYACNEFFDRLLPLKNKLYPNGVFRLQFSIHTTDSKMRDKLVPIKKWSFSQIADYGKKFYVKGDKKIALNFALAKEAPLSPDELAKHFDPKIFLIKITPVNPTAASLNNKIESYFVKTIDDDENKLVSSIQAKGFDVIVSIGELTENKIGSNCGQYLRTEKVNCE